MRTKNPFFRFKQFTVWHDQSALKVCTEACILGAYVSVEGVRYGLDIGAGTGLLSLMMAQRNRAIEISAVEIDEASYRQATMNVQQSDFGSQIKLYHSSIQDWEPKHSGLYELIVSNPPFFTNHLPSTHQRRNRALHTETLTLEELWESVMRLIAPKGRFVVLLPPYETQRLIEMANKMAFVPVRQCNVYQKPDKPLFRQITTFERDFRPCEVQDLYIHNVDGTYAQSFKDLLQDYYLNF